MGALVAPRAKASHHWKRDEFDFYVEPPVASEALFKVERFVGGIWDPACGQGNICRSAIAAGIIAIGTDIIRRVDSAEDNWRWFAGENDFLASVQMQRADNIVSNPPFFRAKGTQAFIRRSLALVPGKICIFAPLGFLAGIGRAEGLFHDHPPARAWIIVPRVSCPPGAGVAPGCKDGAGGTVDWAWLIFDKSAPKQRTELRWLRPEGEVA